MTVSISQEHIERIPGRCGGRPVIANTRIRVLDIHAASTFHGWSPEQIVKQYPPITLADVHAALAYYYDHEEEMKAEIEEERRFVDEMKAKTDPGLLEQKMKEKGLGNGSISA